MMHYLPWGEDLSCDKQPAIDHNHRTTTDIRVSSSSGVEPHPLYGLAAMGQKF